MIGGIYYRLLAGMARPTGSRVFELGAGMVAAGYFALFPRRVTVGLDFYRALLPGRSPAFYRRCVWRQYQSFTKVFVDRFRLQNGGDLSFSSQGWEGLEAGLAQGRGAILLMSHVGSWEIAAQFMRRRSPARPILLFMGRKQKEQIEKIQKQDLARAGLRVVAAGADAASPYEAMEGVRHLRRGGLVSMTGDVLWHPQQRSVTVSFLGRQARLPAAPYALARAAGAPLYPFFVHRAGPWHHHYRITDPIQIRPHRRDAREAALQAAAQDYADLLAAHVRAHPEEWYHFKPFFAA